MTEHRRIFVNPEDIIENSVALSSKNRKYIYDVLRLRPNDRLHASDGSRSFVIKLMPAKGSEVWAVIEQQIEIPDTKLIDITVAFACVRPDPVEQIIRHCTELGTETFAPILFERCSRRPPEKKQRWNNIITTACLQSKRSNRPSIRDPKPLGDFLDSLGGTGTKIALTAHTGSITLLQALEETAPQVLTILVGPEGGLTANEEKMIEHSQFVKACICPSVLRTETAAIAGVSAVICWAMEKKRQNSD
jgi:16S rRNA (uracil1498-N3)-methyltransferase